MITQIDYNVQLFVHHIYHKNDKVNLATIPKYRKRLMSVHQRKGGHQERVLWDSEEAEESQAARIQAARVGRCPNYRDYSPGKGAAPEAGHARLINSKDFLGLGNESVNFRYLPVN